MLLKNSKDEKVSARKSFFGLSSNNMETYTPKFNHVRCVVADIIKVNRKTMYLFETELHFSGFDFGLGLFSINKFLITPRHGNYLHVNKKQDVIVYLPKDGQSFLNLTVSDLVIVDWGILVPLSDGHLST